MSDREDKPEAASEKERPQGDGAQEGQPAPGPDSPEVPAAGAKPQIEGTAPGDQPAPGEDSPEAGEAEAKAEPVAKGQPPIEEPGVEAEPDVEPGAEAEAKPATAAGGGEPRRLVSTAAVSAGVLVFALAFFMAGFAAHALLDDDDGGSGGGGGGGGGGGAAVASNSDDDPFWGPEDAPVVIEEFADFQCPFCARHSTETLPQIREAYGDTVRYIYRDFPLASIHENAQKAAEGGQCAHEQGVFWEFHDILFANQSALTVDELKSYAEQVGADTGTFNECLDSGKYAREVLLDMQDGQGAGVTGTPAFLVNGLLVSGAQPFEAFQQAIDQALAGQ